MHLAAHEMHLSRRLMYLVATRGLRVDAHAGAQAVVALVHGHVHGPAGQLIYNGSVYADYAFGLLVIGVLAQMLVGLDPDVVVGVHVDVALGMEVHVAAGPDVDALLCVDVHCARVAELHPHTAGSVGQIYNTRGVVH